MLRESNIDEAVVCITSAETIGSSQYSRMPFIGPSAAFFTAALISSFVASFFRTATRSTSEPVGVGTLTDIPSSLPFRSGITLPTAFAAPVVVGICERAADLARLRSL